MANWEDIINNHLTMGRSRWLCYRMNEERRRQEQEELEGRPGVRPSNDGREESPRVVNYENVWMENFNRHWVRGRGRAILTPRPFIQVHHGLVSPRPPWGAAIHFGQVVHGSGLDHLRFHIPGPQGVGQVSRGLGMNLYRPHVAGPQHYQPPPPPIPNQG